MERKKYGVWNGMDVWREVRVKCVSPISAAI